MIKLSILLSKAVPPKQNDAVFPESPDPYFLPGEKNKEVMYDFVPFGWSDKQWDCYKPIKWTLSPVITSMATARRCSSLSPARLSQASLFFLFNEKPKAAKIVQTTSCGCFQKEIF